MDIAALQLAIKTRAASDTTLIGASGYLTGWYPNMMPPDPTFPYAVSNVGSWVATNAFTKDINELIIRFSVFHGMEQSGATDPLLACSNILGRIYGNWSSSAPNTAPTYGFHRHTLSISGWTGSIMEFVSVREEHEPGVYHFIQEYKLWLSK